MSQATQYRGGMKRIALAGGIGAGKSTVIDYLRSRGYVALDADEIYRDLTQPGEPLLRTLVDAFGSAVLTPDAQLDRPFLAAIAFSDPTALRRLNAITHGPIGHAIGQRLDDAQGAVAFVAIPLFRDEHREQLRLDEVWSVQVAPELALDRLVTQRAMSLDAAQRRIEAQASNDERARLADEVLWNNADRDALRLRVDELLHERGYRDQ